MKRFLTTVLAASLMLLGTNAFAQQWTAAGGYTMMSFMGQDKPNSLDTSFPGFYFGVNYDYAFSTIDGLTVEPGVYVMHYGKEYEFVGASKSYHANYVRVPINIKYRLPIEGDFDLSAFTGPRFNMGIGGNMFSKGETYMGLKLGDVQWGLGAQATIQDAIMFRLGYDLGLTKCIKDNATHSFDNAKIYRNTMYVGVGFMF